MNMKKTVLMFSYLIFFLLSSCKIKNSEEAIAYSLHFIEGYEDDYMIQFIKNRLQVVDSADRVIYFGTKPGSHILEPSCDICVGNLNISDETSTRIADFIDGDPVTYINFKKTGYIEFGLYFRNELYNYYFIREYLNLDDTVIYSKSYLKQYHLKDNWMLYSDERER